MSDSTIPLDILFEIMFRVADPSQIYEYCRTLSKKISKDVCNNENFWKFMVNKLTTITLSNIFEEQYLYLWNNILNNNKLWKLEDYDRNHNNRLYMIVNDDFSLDKIYYKESQIKNIYMVLLDNRLDAVVLIKYLYPSLSQKALKPKRKLELNWNGNANKNIDTFMEIDPFLLMILGNAPDVYLYLKDKYDYDINQKDLVELLRYFQYSLIDKNFIYTLVKSNSDLDIKYIADLIIEVVTNPDPYIVENIDYILPALYQYQLYELLNYPDYLDLWENEEYLNFSNAHAVKKLYEYGVIPDDVLYDVLSHYDID